jgi:hypothetical protein
MRIVQNPIGALKEKIKKSAAYPRLRDARILLSWISAGRPLPPPHLVKQRTVRQYARRFRLTVFLETGTYRGDMVEAVKDDFERLYSIELGGELCRRAKARFAGDDRIAILQGDSGEVLGALLARIERPCLFWLDSHYSDADTARGERETPILRELEHIVRHPLAHRHVILIDDARLFTGEHDYPTVGELEAFLAKEGFPEPEVRNDIIRIRKSWTPVP